MAQIVFDFGLRDWSRAFAHKFMTWQHSIWIYNILSTTRRLKLLGATREQENDDRALETAKI